MYNSELYKQLEAKYGIEKMIDFSEMVSEMYHILNRENWIRRQTHRDSEPEEPKGYDYESRWWSEVHESLIIEEYEKNNS